jgi:hypothetical protein
METKSTVPKQGAISARQRSPPAEVAVVALKLGFTAFGGPAVHIAMLRQEVVVRRRWMTDEEFMDALGATNLIPGPNSTEMMIHVGLQRAGWAGLVVGGALFILPAVAIVLGFAWAYVEDQRTRGSLRCGARRVAHPLGATCSGGLRIDGRSGCRCARDGTRPDAPHTG